MDKAKKKVLPSHELLKIIGSILDCCPECRNIHINGIDVFPEQIDGANWELNWFSQSGADHDWPGCLEKISGKISNLRVCYNVAEDM